MTDQLPRYFLRIENFDGTTPTITEPGGRVVNFPEPFPVSDLQFTDTMFVPGQHQLGQFTLTLYDIKDPMYTWLMPYYRALLKEMIVEFYENENLTANPIFKGVIIEPRGGDLSQQQVTGEDIRHKLANRKLRWYEALPDSPNDAIPLLLAPPSPSFQDDFNRAAIGADWALFATPPWTMVDSAFVRSDGSGGAIDTAATWTYDQWGNGRISFDHRISAAMAAAAGYTDLSWDNTYASIRMASDSFGFGYSAFELYNNGVNVQTIIYPFEIGVWNHIDVHFQKVDATTYWVYLDLNSVQIFAYLMTVNPAGGSRAVEISATSIPAANADWDNFVVWTPDSVLLKGDVAPTVETFPGQVFNGVSYLDALEWYCTALNWYARVRYRRGAGNDLFDCGPDIGLNLVNYLTLTEAPYGETDNPSHLQQVRFAHAMQSIANAIRVYGQSRDDANAYFVSMLLSSFLDYGVIDADYFDARVTGVTLAKLIGDNRLAMLGGDIASISATVLDEVAILNRPAIWAEVDWGGFIWGEELRSRFELAMSFTLQSHTYDYDDGAQIISITRRQADRSIDLTLNHFKWTRENAMRELKRSLQDTKKAFLDRGTIKSHWFECGGPDTLHWYVYIDAVQLAGIRVDGVGQVGPANVSLNVDGTDITPTYGGPWAVGPGLNFGFEDVQYLNRPGVRHIVATFDAAATLELYLKLRVLS